MKYEIIPVEGDGQEPWRVTTHGYSHELQESNGQAVISWHWHPDSRVQDPHIHMGSTQLSDDAVISRRTHLPTDRVSLESVVRACIDEFGATPARDDYDKILSMNEGAFKLYRTWGPFPRPAM